MASSSTQSALQQELFNMKMKCHQYEQRLAEVNLHGANGEKIQMENIELREKVAGLEEQVMIREQQMQEMQGVWEASKEALQGLQDDIVHKRELISVAESELKALDEQVHNLETENSSLSEKYNEACKLFKTREGELEEHLTSEQHNVKCLKVNCETLTNESKQLKRQVELKDLKVEQLLERVTYLGEFEVKAKQLEEELGAAMEFKSKSEKLEEKVSVLQAQLNETSLRIERESKEAIAVETEKVSLESETLRREMKQVQTQLEHQLQLTKEQYDAKELECKRLRLRSEQYMTLEENARKDLARIHAELSNVKEHERMLVEQVEQEKEEALDKLRQDYTKEIDDLRNEWVSKVKSKDKTITNLDAMLREAKRQVEDTIKAFHSEKQQLLEENAKIREKWKNSIAGKRASPSVFKTRSVSKPFSVSTSNKENVSSNVSKARRSPLGVSKPTTPGLRNSGVVSQTSKLPTSTPKSKKASATKTPKSSSKKRVVKLPGSSPRKATPTRRLAEKPKVRGRLTNPAAVKLGKRISPITSSLQFR